MTSAGSWITWRSGELIEATCPVCADPAPKPALLDTRTLGTTDALLTLVNCAGCSVRFYPGLDEPGSFADADEIMATTSLELAVGLRGSVDCLARIDTSSVKRFLEVGCGTGLTLDYVREIHGWDVLGVDTSAASRVARREIGVPILDALLGETAEVEQHAWDVVFACEVIEHVRDPHSFVRAVRLALADDGIFLLRTPAAESLDPQRPDESMVGSLSAGYHTMLHTASSLERTLRAAGFRHVRILRDGETLHAAASAVPFEWNPNAALPPEQLERYLRKRTAELPPSSGARLGLLQQLVNDLVNRGAAEDARSQMAELDATLNARYGVGIDATADSAPAFAASQYCSAFLARALQLRLDGDLRGAEERFAAAATVARTGTGIIQSMNAFDPVLEANLRVADRERLPLLAARDPGAGLALLRTVLDEAGADRQRVVIAAFTACIDKGAYAVAAELADEVHDQLRDMPATREVADAHWGLGMLSLKHSMDYHGAARAFAAAQIPASSPERMAGARFYEAYALWHAGERKRALALLGEVVAAGEAAAQWRGRALALLGYSG